MHPAAACRAQWPVTSVTSLTGPPAEARPASVICVSEIPPGQPRRHDPGHRRRSHSRIASLTPIMRPTLPQTRPAPSARGPYSRPAAVARGA
jgi:hypothetical protein